MSKSTKSEKVLDFLAGKGFYIILGLCVVAIAVSGYFLLFGGDSGGHEDDPAVMQNVSPSPSPFVPPASKAPVTIPPAPSQKPSEAPANIPGDEQAVDVLKPADTETLPPPSPTAEPEPEPSKKPKPSPSPQPEQVTYLMPVTGEIVVPHSADELVFNKTMGDWRVHLGVDIAAEPNAAVCASADGKVVDIRKDTRLGTCVVLRHSDGLETLYANLDEAVSVILDQSVKQGDILGMVGQSAEFEAAEVSHLHFEILQDGISLDPEEFFE